MAASGIAAAAARALLLPPTAVPRPSTTVRQPNTQPGNIRPQRPSRRVSSTLVVKAVSTPHTQANATDTSTPANAQDAQKGRQPVRHLFQYPTGDVNASVDIHETSEDVSDTLVQTVLQAAESAIAERGSFTLVLSGGSLMKIAAKLADRQHAKHADFGRWHIFWADERCVPLNSADSNYKGAKDAWLGGVSIPEQQIIRINDSVSPEEAAEDYERQIRELTGGQHPKLASTPDRSLPRFDLVLLGVGPDGHVASLFPNHPALAEQGAWILPITNSPKPPPSRITMTLPVLSAAAKVVVVAVGKEKAEVVSRALERQALPGALPAQMVRPTDGSLLWLIDSAAATYLRVHLWNDPKRFPYCDYGVKGKGAAKPSKPAAKTSA
eukprot:jgi/Chlat1/6850/Chrsp51S06568